MDKKNPGQALVEMRNRKLTPEQRKEIARIAALARWKNAKVKKKGKKADKP